MATRKKAVRNKTGAPPAAADPRFARIARRMMADGKVKQARMFGASGLQQNGKYFAMTYRGDLVVKLPAERLAALVAAGKGKPFDPGHGRAMKEWIAVSPAQSRLWGRLSDEARAYVTATH